MTALSKTLAVAVLVAFPAAQASEADQFAHAVESIRSGGAGIEVAGIVIATVGSRGHLETTAVGCARFDRDGRRCVQALQPNGLMRVASISKLVTAMAVQDAIDRRRLQWDQDASEALGFKLRNPNFPTAPITLRQLANHTSSVIDGDPFWRPWNETIDATTAGTHSFDVSHAPGTYFRYSNFNYVLLGQMLEHSSGLRFDRLMQRVVLQPARIDAGFNWSMHRPIDPNRIVTLYRRQSPETGWDAHGPWIAQVDDFNGRAPPSLDERGNYRVGSNGSAYSPHGGLRISIPDLARLFWALSPRRFQRLRASPFVIDPHQTNGEHECGFYRDFAQGLHSFELPGVGRLWGHFGEAYGLRAGLLRDPASRRVWAYAITGYGDDPDRGARCVGGLDAVQRAVLHLIAAQIK